MDLFGSVQGLVLLVLQFTALGLEVWAFADAARHRAASYPAAGKRTKQFWLLVTGVALLFGIVTFSTPLGLFWIIPVIASSIYLADVRPALQQVRGAGGQRHQGPYGPW